MPSFQVLVLGFADGFLSPFLDSLPQLFLKCLPCAFAFGLFPFNWLSFVCLFSGSGYSASVSSFPSLLGSASQLLSRCPSLLSLPRFPLSLWPGFPCLPSRFLYSAFLFVSFRSSLIRSHSRSSGAYLLLSLSVFSASLPLSFVRFCFASSYLAFCFFLSVLPVSASQWLLRCPSSAFASYVSPFFPA